MRILDVLILDALEKANVRVPNVHETISKNYLLKANALLEQGEKLTASIDTKLKATAPVDKAEKK